jgi:hypothetical protein
MLRRSKARYRLYVPIGPMRIAAMCDKCPGPRRTSMTAQAQVRRPGP